MWNAFETYALITSICWVIAMASSFNKKNIWPTITNITAITGVMVMAVFITQLWINLERPPLRTLGETRLWYAFFIAIIGIVISNRWK